VNMFETYEEAVARTGRKWPFRNEHWPCPVCWSADCDLDIGGEVYKDRRRGLTVCQYRHLSPEESEHNGQVLAGASRRVQTEADDEAIRSY
jgi:hypothetical protein